MFVGYAIQKGLINRVITAPVLITLTLTFGLDLLLNNAMLVAFTADYRKINLAHPLGTFELGPIFLPGDRVAAMALARSADASALLAAAQHQDRPRDRGGPHGSRRRGADGRRCRAGSMPSPSGSAR